MNCATIINEFIDRGMRSFKELLHCLDRLDEKQLWWRPGAGINSVAAILKDISGNVRQWMIWPGINSEEDRDRDKIMSKEHPTKEELIFFAIGIESDFIRTVGQLFLSNLTPNKDTQQSEMTDIKAVFHTLMQLEGRLGQIVLLTSMQLGDKYIDFIPSRERK